MYNATMPATYLLSSFTKMSTVKGGNCLQMHNQIICQCNVFANSGNCLPMVQSVSKLFVKAQEHWQHNIRFNKQGTSFANTKIVLKLNKYFTNKGNCLQMQEIGCNSQKGCKLLAKARYSFQTRNKWFSKK